MKRLLFILIASSLSACTNYLYVAKTTFKDNDHTCQAQAYWYKTDYLIGVKADRTLTVMSGGQRRPVQYKEQEGKLAYMGERSRDQKIFGDKPVDRIFLCGWIKDVSELKQFNGDKFHLYMHCKAKGDELSVAKGYIPAMDEAYTFIVTEQESWSLTGKLPEAPKPPTCTSD